MASSSFELISKKLVKPSSPTPPSLRNYKLSLMDQLMQNKYIPMAFFYANHQNSTTQLSSLLEESLSKTLAFYYPFAGRFRDNLSVDCNDMGATLIDSRIGCKMSEFLKDEDVNAQGIIFPSGLPWSFPGDYQTSLVVAQVTHFECAGIALSVCMSHKIGDVNTLCNFINDWAAMARTQQSSDHHHKPSPQFIGASILPPIEDPLYEPLLGPKQALNYTTRRFVFNLEKINQQKAKTGAESAVEKPTRVEVVSALIYRCSAFASSISFKSFKPSVLAPFVNFRKLIGPPVTQNYVGNFVSYAPISTTDEKGMSFSRLVGEIRNAKLQLNEKYRGIKTDELLADTLDKVEQIKLLQDKNDVDEYICSSFCRYPTYEVNFGWGRPVWVSLAATPFKNYFVLMDSISGGIEAFVTLEGQVMLTFRSHPELLAFASLC